MLVLTRKRGESIVIGRDITVMVLSVARNGTVRIGVEAPKEVQVDREEIAAEKEKR